LVFRLKLHWYSQVTCHR